MDLMEPLKFKSESRINAMAGLTLTYEKQGVKVRANILAIFLWSKDNDLSLIFT